MLDIAQNSLKERHNLSWIASVQNLSKLRTYKHKKITIHQGGIFEVMFRRKLMISLDKYATMNVPS